jgi:prenyltransferase beta subunit
MPIASLLMALLAVLVVLSPVSAQQATPAVGGDPLDAATAWLLTQQAEDGGFVGFSGETDAGTTVDAILALAAAQQAGVEVDLAPALVFLSQGDGALIYAQTGAGQAAKLVLALVAAGSDPHDINGVDPYSLVQAGLNADTGFYGFGAFDHALAMLAMVAVGDDVPEEAVSRLVNAQLEDGSWAFDGSEAEGAGDTNTTAIAIQAMAAAGFGDGRDVLQALDYLRSTQVVGGGFPYQPADGAAADANSTGIVVQALIAAGQDPTSPEWNDAQSALLGFQNESGAFRYMMDPPDDNLFATLQAIPAIAAVPFPIVDLGDVATPIAA